MSNNTATIKTRKNLVSTRTITMTALLAAISYVLAFLEFPVPLSPSFGEFATAICNQLEQAVDGKITTYASITAKPFFEKRGYKVVKERQVERQGIFLTNYVMIKEQ